MSVDFLRYRYFTLGISAFLLGVFVVVFFVRGLNLGLDFTGGVALEVEFDSPVSISNLRDHFKAQASQLPDLSVKLFGSDRSVLIESRLAKRENASTLGKHWKALLDRHPNASTIKRVDFVGPKIGQELSYSGFLSAVVALVLILMYVAFRFELRFALSAVIALFHDVLFVLGVFSVFHISFDLNVLGALLAIIGYSLNDTIVIFDRVRERLSKNKKDQSIYSLVNQALNQTLSRTVITSLTTLLVLIALFVFGQGSIVNFAIAMIMGVLVGTYSSIFVATNSLYLMGVKPLISVQKVSKHDLGNRP